MTGESARVCDMRKLICESNINIKLLYTVAHDDVINILAIFSHGISFKKKIIGNAGTRTCVADISQQPCYPLDRKAVD